MFVVVFVGFVLCAYLWRVDARRRVIYESGEMGGLRCDQSGEAALNYVVCREVIVSDSLPGASNGHDQLLGEEGVQDGSGRWAASLRGMPIRRTSSCSSFGSEGAPLAGSGGGTNGYHRGYQGLLPYHMH